MAANQLECSECDARATRLGSYGEPLCATHWRENGMYDPDQGFEPTARDYAAFARRPTK